MPIRRRSQQTHPPARGPSWRGRARLAGAAAIAALAALAAIPANGPADGLPAGLPAGPAAGPAAAEPGGAVVGWGENEHWQLAAGYRDEQEESPVSALGASGVSEVAAGYHDSFALLGDGTVESWGGNAFGQLGDGTREEKAAPVPVGELAGVRAIAAGGAHGLALLNDGTVMAWGVNQEGELGNGKGGRESETGESGLSPKAVQGLADVVAVAAGGGSNYALLADGTVLAWGENTHGQLGLGLLGPEECNTEIGILPCSTRPRPVLLAGGQPLAGVVALSAGSEAAYALLSDGTVMAWGNNARGALGDGTTADSPAAVPVSGLSGVAALSGGSTHALALGEGGEVFAWGSDTHGQLGGPAPDSCRGEPCATTPQPVAALKKVTAVSAGALGSSLALKGGKVYAWGQNNFGQLGTGSSAAESEVPTAVTGIGRVCAIAAGNQHALALLEAGVGGPPPLLTVAPQAEALKLTWTFPAKEPQVRYTPLDEEKKHWSEYLTLSRKAHKYVLSGLGLRPYEVELTAAGKSRRVVGTPLP